MVRFKFCASIDFKKGDLVFLPEVENKVVEVRCKHCNGKGYHSNMSCEHCYDKGVIYEYAHRVKLLYCEVLDSKSVTISKSEVKLYDLVNGRIIQKVDSDFIEPICKKISEDVIFDLKTDIIFNKLGKNPDNFDVIYRGKYIDYLKNNSLHIYDIIYDDGWINNKVAIFKNRNDSSIVVIDIESIHLSSSYFSKDELKDIYSKIFSKRYKIEAVKC